MNEKYTFVKPRNWYVNLVVYVYARACSPRMLSTELKRTHHKHMASIEKKMAENWKLKPSDYWIVCRHDKKERAENTLLYHMSKGINMLLHLTLSWLIGQPTYRRPQLLTYYGHLTNIECKCKCNIAKRFTTQVCNIRLMLITRIAQLTDKTSRASTFVPVPKNLRPVWLCQY